MFVEVYSYTEGGVLGWGSLTKGDLYATKCVGWYPISLSSHFNYFLLNAQFLDTTHSINIKLVLHFSLQTKLLKCNEL